MKLDDRASAQWQPWLKPPTELPEVTGYRVIPRLRGVGLGRVLLTKLAKATLLLGRLVVSPVVTGVLPRRLLYVG